MPVTGLGGVGSSWEFPVAQRRQPGLSLTPEEEQGLLRRIGSASLSGLAAAGNLLGLPGSMLRDIATWVPGGTPAQNPLDQLLTPFRPDNRISGRELGRGAGLFGKEDNWKNFLGGLAIEIALDPLLPFTFGGSALTRTGQALKGVGALDDALRIANVGKRLGRITLTPEQALSKLAPEAQAAARTALTEATKKAGVPAAQVAEEMTKPIGGLASYGIPFTNTRWVMGQGPTSQAIARGMDVTGKAIAESALGRAIAQQFDPNAMGLFGIMDQKIARAYSRLAPGSRAAALREYFDAVDAFEPTMQKFGQEYGNLLAPRGRAAGKLTRATPSSIIPGDVVFAADRSNYGWVHNIGKDNALVRFRNPDTAAESIVKLPISQLTLKHPSGSAEAAQFADPFNRHVLGRLIRHAAETGGDVDEAFSLIAPKLAKVQQPSGSLKAMIQATGEILHDVNEPIHRSIIEKGGRRGSIEGISDFSYLPRGFKKRYEGESPATPWESPRFFQVRPQSSKNRALPTAIVPEEIKRRILADPKAIAKSDKPLDMDAAAAYIESTYGKWLGKGDVYTGYINTATQAPVAPTEAHAHALADYVFKYPKRGAKAEALPESVLMDNELRYFLGAHKTDRSLDAIHELFSQNMKRAGQGVPLRAAYSAAGLDPDRAMQYVAKLTGKPESLLENSTVSEAVANAAKMAMQFNENPEWAGAIGKMMRTATQWFKDHVTVIWPAFATRNLISGQTVNMLSGVVQTPRDIADYMTAFKDAAKMLKKPEKEFLRELEAWRVVGGQYGFEGASTFRAPTQGPLPGSPFNIKQTHAENVTALAAQRAEREAAAKEAIAAEQAVPSLLSGIGAKVPDRVKRTARATQALHRDILATGAKVNQHVEWMNRVPLYLYMKRKGYTQEMAAKVVGDLQFDYSVLSPFEKNIARVAFPFYTFTKKSAGLVGKTLLERPGGALAQTMRASTAGYSPDQFAPDYVRQTAAIRLPSGKSGEDRYITGFGFAHEDPLSFLSAGEGVSGFIRGAGMEALSRMNPLLKGPAEFSVGQSFFQRGPSGGRPLEDLDPTVGRLLANIAGRKEPVPTGQLFEAIMANLPTTRALTTARTLTDPRKGPIAKAINTLTGMRVNDVPIRTREALIRQVTENLMKDLGAFTFEKVYFPKEQLAKMPPEEQTKAKQLQWLTAALAQRAKERKQEALKNAGRAARQ